MGFRQIIRDSAAIDAPLSRAIAAIGNVVVFGKPRAGFFARQPSQIAVPPQRSGLLGGGPKPMNAKYRPQPR